MVNTQNIELSGGHGTMVLASSPWVTPSWCLGWIYLLYWLYTVKVLKKVSPLTLYGCTSLIETTKNAWVTPPCPLMPYSTHPNQILLIWTSSDYSHELLNQIPSLNLLLTEFLKLIYPNSKKIELCLIQTLVNLKENHSCYVNFEQTGRYLYCTFILRFHFWLLKKRTSEGKVICKLFLSSPQQTHDLHRVLLSDFYAGK